MHNDSGGSTWINAISDKGKSYSFQANLTLPKLTKPNPNLTMSNLINLKLKFESTKVNCWPMSSYKGRYAWTGRTSPSTRRKASAIYIWQISGTISISGVLCFFPALNGQNLFCQAFPYNLQVQGAKRVPGLEWTPVSYTHLTLPTKRIV